MSDIQKEPNKEPSTNQTRVDTALPKDNAATDPKTPKKEAKRRGNHKGKGIDPIRKILYKKARKEGKSKAKSLIEAKGSKKTAYHDIANSKLVITCEKELEREYRAKDITPDYLIKRTEAIIEKAENKGDFTNSHRGLENIGKWTGAEKPQSQIINVYQLSGAETPERLTELARRKVQVTA